MKKYLYITLIILWIFSSFSPICHATTFKFHLSSREDVRFLYLEPGDVLADVQGCPAFSEVGIDQCLLKLAQHFSPMRDKVERRTLANALSKQSDASLQLALSSAAQKAGQAYRNFRYDTCNRLSYSAVGSRWRASRSIWACQFWLDLRRRSLLREAVGDAPLPIRPGRNRPRGPYRLADLWYTVGTGPDQLENLRFQEVLSLQRLQRAKLRVQRVLDDWDEYQDFVDKAARDFHRSGPAFLHYRKAQCEDYTPKLAAALAFGPSPEAAAIACRTLLNVEEATLLRFFFDNHTLMSQSHRGPGHSRGDRR